VFAARFLFWDAVFADGADVRDFLNTEMYFSCAAWRFGNTELFAFAGAPAHFAFSPAATPWRFDSHNVARVGVERTLPW
jgi:hypothetical protein